MLEQLFITVLNMSLTGALIILGVLIARLCLKKAPRIFSYALWAVPLFRLLCPFSFSAGFSLLGLFSDAPTGSQLSYIPDDIGYMHKPQVQLPLPAASEIVNEILPPATPAASMNPMQFWLFLGSWIWILGMALLLGFGLFSLLRFRRKLKNAQHDRDSIYLTEGLPMPFVMGFFRPRIYLPSGLSEEEKPYILLHEKIHIRRKDHLLRILAFLTLCLHWFNPLVYAAYILSGKDMEMSCDEAVIRKYGSSIKKEYSASLLSFATGHRFPLSTPLAFGESDTGARIKNALRYRKPTIIVTCAAIVLCAVVGFALLANPKASLLTVSRKFRMKLSYPESLH